MYIVYTMVQLKPMLIQAEYTLTKVCRNSLKIELELCEWEKVL